MQKLNKTKSNLFTEFCFKLIDVEFGIVNDLKTQNIKIGLAIGHLRPKVFWVFAKIH